MLYWSMLVYKCGREGDQRGVTLEGAMRLYGLQQSELVGVLTLPFSRAPAPSSVYVFVLACVYLQPAH